MSLNAVMTFNLPFTGVSPLPQATLTVYNPNATAVVVTGIQLTLFNPGGQALNVGNLPTPAMGPGQAVSVPSKGSINFGPFPLAVGTGSSGAGSGSVPFPAQSGSNQQAEPPQQQVMLGGVVYGSDGSINVICPAGATFSYLATAPLLSQGGVFDFTQGPNLLTGLIMGVL